jgi:hypothetical protein
VKNFYSGKLCGLYFTRLPDFLPYLGADTRCKRPAKQSNASAESFNAKLKAFRATQRGVTDIAFFLFRVAKIYA